MEITSNEKSAVRAERKCIYVAAIARELLREGHRIVDIKPNRTDPAKTVFVFQNTPSIEDDINAILDRRLGKEAFKTVNARIRSAFLPE